MSKYAQQAKATKKKRTISSLGQAMKKAGKLSPKRSAQLATRQSEMRRQGKKKMMQTAMTAAQKGKTPRKKKPLTASEKRRMQQMKAKSTTARAKASAARMDKRIAETKKKK